MFCLFTLQSKILIPKILKVDNIPSCGHYKCPGSSYVVLEILKSFSTTLKDLIPHDLSIPLIVKRER
jgi:carbonic anhydrase